MKNVAHIFEKSQISIIQSVISVFFRGQGIKKIRTHRLKKTEEKKRIADELKEKKKRFDVRCLASWHSKEEETILCIYC